MVRARIAVLVSGGGTNLAALIEARRSGRLESGEIVLVLSSRADAYALTRAKEAGIEARAVERSRFDSAEAFEAALDSELAAFGVEVIVLAGFMHILSPGFVDKWPERMINVHPSLIPAFCGKGFYGLGVHEAVLASGAKVTGATVHIVNGVPDGGRILLQKAVEVREGDDARTLQRRVMEEAEWLLLPEATENLCKAVRDSGALGPREAREYISCNSYPGRGVILGFTPNGRAALAYFIMGRSEHSRNRVFVRNGDSVGIVPVDAEKLGDPSLIVYSPVRVTAGRTVVTNGDQTDTVCDGFLAGQSFSDALLSREFEPDAPNYTPRISGAIDMSAAGAEIEMSILRRGADGGCERPHWAYAKRNGEGRFIHTYMGDGAPLPSFMGEPRRVLIPEDMDAFACALWDALDANNRISLYVRYTDSDASYSDMLINRYAEGSK